jgi:hypothetical protein
LADTLDNHISKVVDEYVTNIIKLDHSPINQHSYLEYLVHESHHLFLPINLKPVTEKEIYEMNKSLKCKHSCGYDEVMSRIVKLSMPFTSSPSIYICNRMLSTGTFPTHLKLSQVLPTFKIGSKVEIYL